MKSHEVLKDVIGKAGTKRIAAELKVSQPLVYKWCNKPPEDQDDDASGALNPLDRVLKICESSESAHPIEWLCEQMEGFFVCNPLLKSKSVNKDYLVHTQNILQEFTSLLQSISESMGDDMAIDEDEADMIRNKWEDLKAKGEEFVFLCEKGTFNAPKGE